MGLLGSIGILNETRNIYLVKLYMIARGEKILNVSFVPVL